MSTNEIVRRKLEEVLHELRAINLWDREYAYQANPDFIEVAAWKARRRRVTELAREFLRHTEEKVEIAMQIKD